MKRIYTTAIASAMLLLASAAHAQVTLNSVRIGAKDTVALAKFYQAAFGMQEVNRIDAAGGPEIFVNFGATIEAAKASKSGGTANRRRKERASSNRPSRTSIGISMFPTSTSAARSTICAVCWTAASWCIGICANR